MTVVESRIEKLKTENTRLTSLLEEPEPGLTTWLLAVHRRVDIMNEILEGEHDE